MTASAPEMMNEAIRLHRAGRFDEAAARLDDILRAEPGNARAWLMLGVARMRLGDHAAAAEALGEFVRLDPNVPEAHNNLGVALRKLDRVEQAIASYRRAIELRPAYAEAHYNLANALAATADSAMAVLHYRRAIQARPDYAEAHYNLGNALDEAGLPSEAIVHYRRAIAAKPDYAEAYNNLGAALYNQRQYTEAAEQCLRAIEIRPDYAEAYCNLGNAYRLLRQYDAAIASFQRTLELRPYYRYAFGQLLFLRQSMCDWRGFDEAARELRERVRGNLSVEEPFIHMTVSEEPDQQLLCARQCLADKFRERPKAVARSVPAKRDRLRIGYVSADYWTHATAFLIAELFEHHDRSRFEVWGFSYGPDEKSEMGRRLERAFDHFVDLRTGSDAEAARQIAEAGIDIAIDLKGHTEDTRIGIFAHRPAPVQVHYIGYPATTGADFIDYILVDPFVVPADQQPFFSERLVHLPDCYQVNDSKRAIADITPNRAEFGLPAEGFIFCCFNNTYKVTPMIWDIWMRLLHAVPGSVLWLLRANEWTDTNLRREAAGRGVDPARLVFTPFAKLPEYLARSRLADLFLDTLPVNAHTTASDALWVGLPVLTCAGKTFVGRVAGSLLHAIGLPELVTDNLADYEALALKLAREPEMLRDLRARLARNRLTTPLFDTDRFRRHIEAAYTKMWDIACRGEAPRAFAVPPEPR
ncbi:MAG TPA: tetratricopeptide repeat protein [Candidatus Cybelea sp.]|nr:tetratricopeptide repeat protein [Candidatus Cybelea sp.]